MKLFFSCIVVNGFILVVMSVVSCFAKQVCNKLH